MKVRVDSAGSVVKVVKVFVFLLIVPAFFTVRELQLNLHTDELIADATVLMLILTSFFAGSAVVFISSLEAMHRNAQRQQMR